MEPRKSNKISVILGVVLVAAAGIAFVWAYKQARNEANVMVAATDLPAYTFSDTSDLQTKAVPEASIEDTDLTEDEYNEAYSESGVVLTTPVLQGQRIDTREIAEGAQQSFAVVLPDERVIGVTASSPGAVLGSVRAGDVIDVSRAGDEAEGGSAEFAKVICVAAAASGCETVLPPGADITGADTSADDGSLFLLLAVSDTDADTLAGYEVSASLNTLCKVDREGYLYSTREGEEEACNAGDRLASGSAVSDDEITPSLED